MLNGKVLVAQGGGPTAVINQSLVGAVLESRKFRNVDLVYGALYGVRGIVDEEILDLTQETTHNLELVAQTPSSALGSTRDKPDLKYCQEIFKVLRAHGVAYFFYIGGNDSSDTVRIVSEESAKAGYPLRCIHIPKTIDNDLVENDHTPGYPSAARFVAQAFIGANLDNRSLPGVYLAVVMGRHAGFLTAAAALGKKFPDDGPHLIYLPERNFDIERFLSDVKSAYDRHGRCVIAVSEGIHDGTGTPIALKLAKEIERDAHGNVQLSGTGQLADLLCDQIKQKLKIKRVRGDTLGYLQRSFVGCVSDVDQREAREVGEKAVQYAMWEDQDGSVAIRRTGFYSVDYRLLPLAAVADAAPELIWYATNYPPAYITSGTLKGQGFADTRDLFITRTLEDYRLTPSVANTARLFEEMKRRDNACSGALIRTPEREKFLVFSDPVAELVPAGLITLTQRKSELTPYLNAHGELRLDELVQSGKFKLGVAAERSYGVLIDTRLQPGRSTETVLPFFASDLFISGLLKVKYEKSIDAVMGYPIELSWGDPATQAGHGRILVRARGRGHRADPVPRGLLAQRNRQSRDRPGQ